MSRTACCFLALGISVAAFAAACGDDSGDGGTGGSGGSGASGGSGGGSNAGSAGSSAGEAGTSGIAGAGGGSAGTGNGGTGGSAAGAAGSSAGTAGAGTVEPDAGADSGTGEEPDSGTVVDAGGNQGPADSGVNGDCAGFTTGLANIDAPNNQDVVIARVIFNPDATTATVVLRVVAAGGFEFGGGQQLCWGPTDAECAEVDDGITGSPSLVNAEIPVVVGTVDSPVTADEGEVLFANDFATANPDISFAYLNWNDHVSADPAGAAPTLETLAGAFWTPGASVALAGAQNAIFVNTANGDTTSDAGFGVCTADQF